MVFCLACRRFISRNTLFCPGCGGAIGGVRCKNGHTITGTMSAQFCSTCRSRQFINAAPTVNLGCLSRLLAWTAAILLLKLAFTNIEAVSGTLWNLFFWVVGCKVIVWFLKLIELLLIIRIFVWFVSFGSKEFAQQIDPFPKIVPALFRLMGKTLVWFLRALLYVVEGRQFPAKSGKKRPKAEESDDGHS